MSFAMVPDWVLRRGLSATAVLLYANMALVADGKTRRMYHGQTRLAELTGTSVPTVKRALRELREAKAITVEARWRGTERLSNLYVLPSDDPLAAPGEPIALPLDDALAIAEEACLEAAMETVRREGRTPRNPRAYARPRSMEFHDRHRVALDKMQEAGATKRQMVDYVVSAEVSLLHEGPDLKVVDAPRPRLKEFRQASLDETDAWQAQQPVDITRHINSVREALGTEASG